MSTKRTTTTTPPQGTAASTDGSSPHPFPYEPDRETWTPDPTPGATRCPRCGATTINVQGPTDCTECAPTEVGRRE